MVCTLACGVYCGEVCGVYCGEVCGVYCGVVYMISWCIRLCSEV